MSAIVVQAFVTLDGVVQSGGAPDEDRDGGFELGGWALDYDERMDDLGEIGQIVAKWETRTEGLLLGRRTYEIFAGSWGVWDEDAEGLQGELTRRYNRIPKYRAGLARSFSAPTCRTCIIESAPPSGSADRSGKQRQVALAGATSKLNIIPLSWCSAIWQCAIQ